MAKTYTVNSHHNGHCTPHTGTIEELSTKVFGYMLECGHSWNQKIPLRPKTIKSLVNALNDWANECRRYNDHYSIG